MKSYNIVFGNLQNQTVVKYPDFHDTSTIIVDFPVPEKPVDGWVGNFGPDIPWKNWPRNKNTKTPMAHIITIRVPEEYRKKDPNLVALSLFQGEFEDEENITLNPLTAFAKDYYNYAPHPHYSEIRDFNTFGYIWLTEEEFSKGQKKPIEDLRPLGYPDNMWATAWKENKNETYFPAWLTERIDDPNTGKIPNEEGDYGYLPH